jgi:DNA polymerase III subunit delta
MEEAIVPIVLLPAGGRMDSLLFLDRIDRLTVQPIYVLHGEELFLKRQVLTALRTLILGPDAELLCLSSYPGDKVSFATVRNDLATAPFLSPRRLVIIENADPFITNERKKLEKYVADPSPNGVLVLDVKTWAGTTNLAKMLENAAILCKAMPVGRLPEWCQKWCLAQYRKPITTTAARLLVDHIGADMGLLDQELNKLSLYVGEAAKIEDADVDHLVGHSRQENIWKIFDLIAAGQTGPALTLLGLLFTQGENEMRLLAAFGSTLRKVAQLARLVQGGTPLNAALSQAGINFPAARQGAEQQFRHLGRQRLAQIYDLLIETDLGMKGSSYLTPRMLLERLVVQLARTAP